MEINLALPFLTMKTSESAGNYIAFLALSLFWIMAIFVYTGLAGLLGRIASALA